MTQFEHEYRQHKQRALFAVAKRCLRKGELAMARKLYIESNDVLELSDKQITEFERIRREQMSNAGDVIATFEYIPSGVRYHLKRTVLGGLYRQFEGGHAGDNTALHTRWDSEGVSAGEVRVIVSPQTLYHVWHICQCDECTLVGGRIFDHSQGNFSGHLRSIPNELLFTFPTAQEGNARV